MTSRWWVVRHNKTGDYVSPSRKMVRGLLNAGVWDEDRARKISWADHLRRVPMPLDAAARLDAVVQTGSVAELIADRLSSPECSEERPDGYVFTERLDGPRIVIMVDGAAIGDVCSYGHSEALEDHPRALAHARWRLQRMASE